MAARFFVVPKSRAAFNVVMLRYSLANESAYDVVRGTS